MKHTVFVAPLAIALAPITFTPVAFAQSTEPTPTATPAITATPAPTVAPETNAEAAEKDEANEREVLIVVTPTRNPRSLSETTAAVTVISPRQIEQKKPFDITDILRQVPSLQLAQTGSRGKQASVFLRGASPSQTLVLMDGVRVNAPTFGSFDFGTLAVDNIERIEVLRGPQSGLYGADAIGGVINIITKRGTGEFRTGGRLELGNYSTNKQVFTARGDVGKNRLSFSATRLDSEGIRANDDYRSIAASMRFDHPLSSRANLAFIGQFDDANLGVPGQIFGVEPDERAQPRSLFGSIQLTNSAGRRSDKISLGFYDRKLKGNDPNNPGDTFFGTSSFSDKVATLDAQTAFNLGRHTLTTGLEYRRQRANINNSSNFGPSVYGGKTSTKAVFVQDELKSGKLGITLSGRYEDNSQFGGDLNGRFGTAYDLGGNSRLKAAIGTGFQAPTVDQLYSPFGGNVNLRPVENVTYEVGYERDMPRGGRLETTIFRSRYRDLIGFDANFNTLNVDRATGEGLEVSLDQPFGKGFRAVVNGGLLDIGSTNNRNVLRRPKYTAAADLLYRRNKAEFDLGVVSYGRRFDVGQTGAQIFGGYTRVDFTAGYEVRPGLKVYSRVQNLLNRRYEEVVGYPAPRLNFVVG
ncbi:MAG TPA: TonB-dependent receptor, partial [Abditibacteriaceae bacterium]